LPQSSFAVQGLKVAAAAVEKIVRTASARPRKRIEVLILKCQNNFKYKKKLEDFETKFRIRGIIEGMNFNLKLSMLTKSFRNLKLPIIPENDGLILLIVLFVF